MNQKYTFEVLNLTKECRIKTGNTKYDKFQTCLNSSIKFWTNIDTDKYRITINQDGIPYYQYEIQQTY